MKPKKSYTLRSVYMLMIILGVIGMVGVCLLINVLFMERFYRSVKKKDIISAYQTLNAASRAGSMQTTAFADRFEEICEKENLKILIIDADSQTVISSGDVERMLYRLWENLFDPGPGATMIRLQTLEREEDFTVQIVESQSSGWQYMEAYGELAGGEYFFISGALQAIHAAVYICNQFMLLVGLCAVIVGIFLAVVLSRKAARPINELQHISERMKRLDFDAKYEPMGRMEVDVLGQNMNEVSETLERTISELKTANYELQQDILEKTELDERRKEFLSNVSHELKTPLALIQGYAEGLKEGMADDPENRAFYCEVIADEASRMNTLVKRIITLNQLESGASQITFERFDLIEMLQSSVRSADILTKGVNATVLMDKYPPTHVWSDEFAVEEVVENYLQNAVHHVAGERIIEIKVTRVQRDGKEKIRVSVFNTGNPIPEESIDRVWEKFYKVDKARTHAYGGSGVGLSIVKAIMESLGERYGVDNYDNGVAFWFELDSGVTSEDAFRQGGNDADNQA